VYSKYLCFGHQIDEIHIKVAQSHTDQRCTQNVMKLHSITRYLIIKKFSQKSPVITMDTLIS